jgi:hypothetical protein
MILNERVCVEIVDSLRTKRVRLFFGEGCLAGQARRIATVATIMDSVIVRLEKAAIVRVIHQEPAFSEMFIAHLLARAIRVEADLVDQLFNSSEKRLARLLIVAKALRRKDVLSLFAPNCPSVLSVWKPAVRPIIGRAS